jgi:hypothetical protein
MAEIWGAVAGAVVGGAASLYGSSKAKKGQKAASAAALAEQQRQFDMVRSDNLPALEARNNALGSMINRYASIAGQGQTGANALANASQNYANNAGNIMMSSANAQGAANIAQGNVYSNLANQLGAIGSQWKPSGATSPGYGFGSGSGYGNQDLGQNFADGGPVGWRPRMGQGGGFQMPQMPQMPQMTPPDGTYQPDQLAPMIAQGPDGADQFPRLDMWRGARQQFGTNHPLLQQAVQARRSIQPVRAYGYADGGRVEPVPGTKAPVRPGGTGGGLNALKDAIQDAKERQAAKYRTSPLVNPKSVIEERLRQAGEYSYGGEVDGPGGPRDDAIPARLSDGEHVIDTASVNALGGGDNERGQMLLNQLREMLKAA